MEQGHAHRHHRQAVLRPAGQRRVMCARAAVLADGFSPSPLRLVGCRCPSIDMQIPPVPLRPKSSSRLNSKGRTLPLSSSTLALTAARVTPAEKERLPQAHGTSAHGRTICRRDASAMARRGRMSVGAAVLLMSLTALALSAGAQTSTRLWLSVWLDSARPSSVLRARHLHAPPFVPQAKLKRRRSRRAPRGALAPPQVGWQLKAVEGARHPAPAREINPPQTPLTVPAT